MSYHFKSLFGVCECMLAVLHDIPYSDLGELYVFYRYMDRFYFINTNPEVYIRLNFHS